jgi:peptide/nickel transport system permease protein
MACSAPLIASQDPGYVDVLARLKPPMWTPGAGPLHYLGTDTLGRDVFARVVYGARVSLGVGLSVVALAGTAGVVLGLGAGYFGGWLDDLISRIADIQLAMPFLLLAIAVLAVLGGGLANVILVLVAWNWVPFARVVRGETLSLRSKEFVESARCAGATTGRVLFRHILPNATAPILVMGSLAVSNTIVAEASLSFLGIGVPPSTPTWGAMLAEGRNDVQIAWWTVTFPGIAIMATVLSINLGSDWLQDQLDPRRGHSR